MQIENSWNFLTLRVLQLNQSYRLQLLGLPLMRTSTSPLRMKTTHAAPQVWMIATHPMKKTMKSLPVLERHGNVLVAFPTPLGKSSRVRFSNWTQTSISLPVTLAALAKISYHCGRTPARSSEPILRHGISTRCTFENIALRSARGSATRRLHVSRLSPSGHISIDAPNRCGMF